VELVNSGDEWLGLIPVGWIASRLKYYAAVQTGITLGKDVPADMAINLPYLRVANVQIGRVNLDEVKTVSVHREAWASHRLRDGDVLMTEGGDIDKLGRGSLWAGQIDPCIHQNHIFAVRCTTALSNRWLVYVLDAPAARQYFQMTAKKTTNLASTNSTVVGAMPLVLPPLSEQVHIAERLDEAVAVIDELVAKANQFIETLMERRQALISAAVTGKIDVRGIA
jgi:type I restriction enzyme S subunit